MKVNLQLLKLSIKLIILLILFVILFMISAVLYSARYWTDVYNYINANITIKRIPTITELNLTILYEGDFTTEISHTTDSDYTDITTDNFDDSTEEIEDFFSERKKRQIKIEETVKDYIELPKSVDYVFLNENPTTEDMRDSVDERKLTARDSEDIEMIAEVIEKKDEYQKLTELNTTNAAEVYSWIASIYIKNGTSNQFDYFCDGALLSHNVIITAARCVRSSNATLEAENLLMIAGKRSLQATEDGERVHRVKQITVHENFTTTGETENDLAILVLEEPVAYSTAIQAARLQSGEAGEYGESLTTGWAVSGNLTPIYFDNEKTRNCVKSTASVNTFCSTYGNDITTCPSYGGLYVTKLNNQWTLQGLRTGDPTDRSFCIDKTVMYTSLLSYIGWIIDNIALNKDY